MGRKCPAVIGCDPLSIEHLECRDTSRHIAHCRADPQRPIAELIVQALKDRIQLLQLGDRFCLVRNIVFLVGLSPQLSELPHIHGIRKGHLV